MNNYSVKTVSELDYIKYLSDFFESKISEEIENINASRKRITDSYHFECQNDQGYPDITHFTLDVDEKEYYCNRMIKTLTESLILRQITIVEKFLVELSITLYKKLTEELSEIHLPPYLRADAESKFSDSILAYKYLVKKLKLDLNGEHSVIKKNYEIYQLIRGNIRHKLAHGELVFLVNKGLASDINKSFPDEHGLISFQKYFYITQDNKAYIESKKKHEKSLIDTEILDANTFESDDFDDDPLDKVPHNEIQYYSVNTGDSIALRELNSKLRKLVECLGECVNQNRKLNL